MHPKVRSHSKLKLTIFLFHLWLLWNLFMMKGIQLFIALLFLGVCHATKFGDVVESLGSNSIIRINDKNYKGLMNNEDYSIIIFITASDPRIGCTLCSLAMPQYEQMASSYYENLRNTYNSTENSRVRTLEEDGANFIIAYADLAGSKKLYEKLGVTSVPKVFFYKPGRGVDMSQPTDEYRFSGQETPQVFSDWIVKHSEFSNKDLFKIVEKPNYQVIARNMAITLFLLVVAYKKFDKVSVIIANKRIWRALCLILIILFCSGYMYNRIRGTAFTGEGPHKEVIYFSPSQQSQYGAETQIISVVYALLVVCFVVLMDSASKISDQKLRFFAVLASSLVAYILYGYVVACFKQKSSMYPFKLGIL